MKRVQHPYIKNATCIIVKVKCNCPCHNKSGMMHFVACCNFGYIDTYTEIIKK